MKMKTKTKSGDKERKGTYNIQAVKELQNCRYRYRKRKKETGVSVYCVYLSSESIVLGKVFYFYLTTYMILLTFQYTIYSVLR